MIDLRALSKNFPATEQAQSAAILALPQVKQLKQGEAIEFSSQLAEHGLAVHQDRQSLRSRNNHIRSFVNTFMAPLGYKLARRRMTAQRAKTLGFDETFNFYVLVKV